MKEDIDDLKFLATSDPLELASSLETIFGKEVFRARLSKTFENRAGNTSDCQTAIASLNLRGIVTLNYDNGHEVAYANKIHRHAVVGRSQDSAILTRWLQEDIFEQRDLPILHFHGDTTDPEKMVLTGDDYNQFYADPLSEALIMQLWRTNRLLVLGFGFSDPFLTRVAEKTLRSLASESRHFALIGRRQSEPTLAAHRQRFAKKYRLTPVFYEIKEKFDSNGLLESEDHSALPELAPVSLDTTLFNGTEKERGS